MENEGKIQKIELFDGFRSLKPQNQHSFIFDLVWLSLAWSQIKATLSMIVIFICVLIKIKYLSVRLTLSLILDLRSPEFCINIRKLIFVWCFGSAVVLVLCASHKHGFNEPSIFNPTLLLTLRIQTNPNESNTAWTKPATPSLWGKLWSF